MVKVVEFDLDMLFDEYEYYEFNDDLVIQQWYLCNCGYIFGVNYCLWQGVDVKVFDVWCRFDGMGFDCIIIVIIDNGFDVNYLDLRIKLFWLFDLWIGFFNMMMGDVWFIYGMFCVSVVFVVSNGWGIVGVVLEFWFMLVNGILFSNWVMEQVFDYCMCNGVDIISCSWGIIDFKFSLGSIKEQVIVKVVWQGCNGKGCVILYVVGNDDKDYVNFYVVYFDVIVVVVFISKDIYVSYFNWGWEIDICVFFNGDWLILVVWVLWDFGLSWEMGVYKYYWDGCDWGLYYKYFGGIFSFIFLVVGICVFMFFVNFDFIVWEVKEIFCVIVDKIGVLFEYVNGWFLKYGYGRVNVDKVVVEVLCWCDCCELFNVVLQFILKFFFCLILFLLFVLLFFWGSVVLQVLLG